MADVPGGRRRRVCVEADGGSRGNPGPAAYGALVRDPATGTVLAEAADSLGVATNNLAEYHGLIAGLELVREVAPDAAVEVRMDSKLVIEQMAGRWKVKHPDLRPLVEQGRQLAPPDTEWTWVPREQNDAADALLNRILDGGDPIRWAAASGSGRDGGERQKVAAENAGRVEGRDVDAEVAVVGLGAMGAHTLWRLAMRGVSAIGIERFTPGHVMGSSHGRTRLFRVACLEHPNLVTIARRTRDLWTELQPWASEPILRTTGGVMIGAEDSGVIAGTLAAADAHRLPVERLTREELMTRFPQHAAVGDADIGIWDPEAGVVHPETAIRAAVSAAVENGAEVYPDTRVTAIEPADGGVLIHTATRTFAVRQVVVTAGPWLGGLMPGLRLSPVRTPMTWFEPRADEADAFELDRLGVFIRAITGGPTGYSIWGHGATAEHGVKIGVHNDPALATVDPDLIDRGTGPGDYALVSDLVRTALPGLNPVPTSVTTCMVTHSGDGQFIIGRPGGDPRLVVGGGGSGHAFKHSAGIGELLAQITTGENPYVDTAFVDPDRASLR